MADEWNPGLDYMPFNCTSRGLRLSDGTAADFPRERARAQGYEPEHGAAAYQDSLFQTTSDDPELKDKLRRGNVPAQIIASLASGLRNWREHGRWKAYLKP